MAVDWLNRLSLAIGRVDVDNVDILIFLPTQKLAHKHANICADAFMPMFGRD